MSIVESLKSLPVEEFERQVKEIKRGSCKPSMLEKGISYIVASTDFNEGVRLNVLHCLEVTQTCYKVRWEDDEKPIWVGIIKLEEMFETKNFILVEKIKE